MAPGSNLNASITYQTLSLLSLTDGFYILYCVHFCDRLDIVSLFLSAFSLVFSLVCLSNKFTLVLFQSMFTFLFLPFHLLHCPALAMLSTLFFLPCNLIFYPLLPLFSETLCQIWWIIFCCTCIGPPLSHKYL